MNTLIEILNRFGGNAFYFAWPMLWQSSVLITVLFAIDFALRRRVRAAVRYALWLVLLAKLLLPPSLTLPTSAAWWLFPSATSIKQPTTRFVVSYGPDIASRLPSQPAPVFTPPRPPMSAATWIVPVWSALSIGLLVWMTARWRQVARDVKRAAPAPAWLNELFNAAKSSIGLRRAVRLRVTDQAMSPAVCGLFRPVILLPQSLVEKLSPVQLRAVLLHELTHLRRGDVWMNCAQALVQIVYWWHPLLWFANARIRRVREEAVDDAVMLALSDDAETYAPTLLEVAKLAFHRPLASLGLVGILESRSALRQRIERLMNFRAPRKAGLTIASVLGILAFTALAIPMGAAPSHSSNLSDRAGSPTTADNPPPPAGTDSEMAGPATMTFKIDRPPDANRLKQLLLDAGVKMPPTVYVYSDNGALLVRGDPEQLALVNSAVLKLNGYLPKEKVGGKPENRGLPLTTNFFSTDARRVIYSKLDRIRFDQVSWPDGLPLSEVLRMLSLQTKLCDPDKKGIIFTFHTNAPAASAATASASGSTTINPTTGLPDATTADVAVDPSSINVKLTLTDIRLADLLDAILLAADHPIKYSILDDGIVFSTRDSNSAPLETRTFKVDTNVFLAALQKQTGLKTNVSAAFRQFLSNVGVDMTPPKSIYYNETRGILFLHATGQDLDVVEKAVQVVTYTPPPQIHIKARFIEVPEAMVKGLRANLIPTDVTNVAGILTDPTFRLVLHALEQSQGTETLAEPDVTTIIGRQTQMRATTILTIITNFVFLETSTNSAITPQQSQVEVGPILDVIPVVLSDGYTINLTLIPSLTEFLGYDKPPTNSTPIVTSTGAIVDVPNILPRFSVWQTVAHLKLWDNQTVVLGGWISTQTQTLKEDTVPVSGSRSAGEPLFREQITVRKSPKRQLLVFITATLVDRAGNRVHNDDEMPFAQNSIPPQDSP
jgi:beta-lactamase regulating signal transducer with metallopeptidase domain